MRKEIIKAVINRLPQGLYISSWEYDKESCIHKFPLKIYNLEGEVVQVDCVPALHEEEFPQYFPEDEMYF